jgi:hypothetical protein
VATETRLQLYGLDSPKLPGTSPQPLAVLECTMPGWCSRPFSGQTICWTSNTTFAVGWATGGSGYLVQWFRVEMPASAKLPSLVVDTMSFSLASIRVLSMLPYRMGSLALLVWETGDVNVVASPGALVEPPVLTAPADVQNEELPVVSHPSHALKWPASRGLFLIVADQKVEFLMSCLLFY